MLIFLVLGTMLMGLATPTESGAMGTVGALVLAVLRHPQLGNASWRVFSGGLVAAGIAAIIGIYAFKSLPFQVAIAVLYVAIVWMLAARGGDPGAARPHPKAFETTMRLTAMVIFILIGSTCFSIVFQGVNGGPWLEHLMTGMPGGVWGFLHRREPLHLLHRVLPRLLRDRLHHRAAARADREGAAHARSSARTPR